ncbi:MAG TPA: ribosomal-protein-alanine N-acetyltransferase [Clostridiales bacterium]|nr:ribosomal-protein-alanine N-acetyltransferase [Clostridiales bacterium]
MNRTSLRILPMEFKHIDRIMQIELLSFKDPWSRNSFLGELENPAARYLVAELGGEVVGYGGYWLIIDEAHITNVAVHPDYRRQGVGEAILEAMIHLSQKENAVAMTLEVRVSNKAAQQLYARHGFTVAGLRKRYYQDNGEDALILWRKDSDPPHR